MKTGEWIKLNWRIYFLSFIIFCFVACEIKVHREINKQEYEDLNRQGWVPVLLDENFSEFYLKYDRENKSGCGHYKIAGDPPNFFKKDLRDSVNWNKLIRIAKRYCPDALEYLGVGQKEYVKYMEGETTVLFSRQYDLVLFAY